MKKILIQLVIVTGLLLTSCEADSTDGVSSITNYPEFTVLGDSEIIIKKGATYTEQGVEVTEGGQEIEYTTTVVGTLRGGTTLDTNVPDIYNITYTAVNKDGFKGTTTRTVIVTEDGDLVNSIAGLYTATCSRNNVLTAQYTDMEYVLIYTNTDGSYQISDGIGLYYAVGRAYGNGYLSPAKVIANSIPSNNYTYSPFTVGTFGGECVMTGLTANPTDSTVKFSTDWDSGYTFDVVLKKIQL